MLFVPSLTVNFIALMIGLSIVMGFLGRHRKMGFWGYFFASMLLTPLMGLLLVLVSDKRPMDV